MTHIGILDHQDPESLARAYDRWRRARPFVPFVTASLAGFALALGILSLVLP